MELSNTAVQNLEYFIDTLDFATLESDKDSQCEDTMEEEFEEINQFNEKSEEIDENDQIAINNLIDKLRSCCSYKDSCIEKNTLSTETVNKTKSFINLMGERHSEALAVRKYTRKKTDRQIIVIYEKHDNILLPSYYSYDHLLATYNLMNSNNLIKNVCDEYTLFKQELKESNNINEDLNIQLSIHIADYRAMRDAYEDDI
ncbi:14688_t:CDS:2 [Racocetra fulgida]|uniref:14688_t:CDS:1 n=1 Tax=Racocetra fulgida TaxID=60492 RepID=A0A9N8ZYG1_9GLOM|nr:14688_t:CDS:2 [Racocetra fulgida]